jgi:transposase-like protein
MDFTDKETLLGDIYGAEISTQTISNMTDRVLPLLEEWRNRPLEPIYAILYHIGRIHGNGKNCCGYASC